MICLSSLLYKDTICFTGNLTSNQLLLVRGQADVHCSTRCAASVTSLEDCFNLNSVTAYNKICSEIMFFFLCLMILSLKFRLWSRGWRWRRWRQWLFTVQRCCPLPTDIKQGWRSITTSSLHWKTSKFQRSSSNEARKEHQRSTWK